jgi:tRNA 5-methylaminomethyl-2-thiouridine biosynthesis bifunctional protein
MPPIVPARLAYATDGTPYSADYDDVYHSAAGALEQARHVFIGGNDLPARWHNRERFVILETGFGIGLNFLATWQAWRGDPQRCKQLHFVSAEKHPFTLADLVALHRRWPELSELAEQLQCVWPVPTAGFQRLHLDDGRVTLTLLFGDATDSLRSLKARADAIYLDGFSPAKNPELWSSALLQNLTLLAADDATLATWSVSGAVREALAGAGWLLEKRPGFGHKRDMLCGKRESPKNQPQIVAPQRHAIVIGAGIAGCTIAASLAKRGWQIELIERHGGPAQEASGNPAGIMLPLLARDDNLSVRLSRASFFYALRLLHELTRQGSPLRWSLCGVVQIGHDSAHEAQQRQMVERLGLPPELVTFLNQAEMTRLLGAKVDLGGWHFPLGGWISPPTLCQALLELDRVRIHRLFGVEVAGIERLDTGWRVIDALGQTVAEAPHIIFANAHAVRSLLPDMELPLIRIRGQVSFLPGTALEGLQKVVCREGYVTPPAAVGPYDVMMGCLGATFDFGDEDPQPRSDSHARNLERLGNMLPGYAEGIDPATLEGRVGFRNTTPDRLPMIGALPADNVTSRREVPLAKMERIPGLHCLLGYGARGMVWAPLAAELLAAQLENEPLPFEVELVAAVDPARFLLRARRRGSRPTATGAL